MGGAQPVPWESPHWPAGQAKHDVDNIKALLDACAGILWADDGQIEDLHTMKGFDKENPRVEMRVWELRPTSPTCR